MYNYRNPQFTSDGGIDCEIEHPQFGWVPYTAYPDSGDANEAALHSSASTAAAPYVAPAIPDITREEAIATILGAFEAWTGPITEAYSSAERLSWPSKEDAARSYQAALPSLLGLNDFHKDMIENEAAAAGVDPSDLCTEIITRAVYFREIIASVSGWRKKAKADLDLATDSAGFRAVIDDVAAKIAAFSTT